MCLTGFSGLSGNGNNLFAIWTDLREDKHNKIYGASSGDGGETWTKNLLVYKSPIAPFANAASLLLQYRKQCVCNVSKLA